MNFHSSPKDANSSGNFNTMNDDLDQIVGFDSFYNIKIVKQSPDNVFSDEWFEVALAIECVAPHSVEPNDVEVKVATTLTKYPCGEEGSIDELYSDAVLKTNPEIVTLNLKKTSRKSKTVVVKCKITSNITLRKITKYSISFSSSSVSPDSLLDKIIYASLAPIQIVNAKIIVDSEKWSSVWFKDEGGKENGMEANISLRDADGEVIRNRKIPLKLTLLYDNELQTKVMKQDTLRILGSSDHYIDPDNGKCSIHFRIEDVSKNHQGQNFKLEITPDVSKVFDIAHTCTPSVSIRSKRNKRKSTGNPRRNNFEKKINQMFPGEGFKVPEETNVSLSPVGDIERLRQAMKGVIDWTEQIINGLFPLKWNLIGYGQYADGTTDFSRPYHNMPNPNDFITRVLSIYSEQTRNHLQILKTAVENTSRLESQVLQTMMPQMNQSSKFSFTEQPQNTMNQGNQFMMGKMMNPHGMNPNHGFNEEHNVPSKYQVQNLSQINVPMMGSHYQVRQQDTPRHMNFEMNLEEDKNPHKVEYVLAKQFKSLFNGSRLGFPAFNKAKVIVGFYKESTIKVGVGRFVPIAKHKNEFGPRQMAQATIQLEDAIENDSSAVHSLREWGSLESMVDHVIVYAWRHDFSNPADDPSPSKNKQSTDNTDDPSECFNSDPNERRNNLSFQKNGNQDLMTW